MAITLEEATKLVTAAVEKLPVERIPLDNALDRITAEEVRAEVNLPPFDRSAMDGFAVRAEDTVDLKPLELVGDIPAGMFDPPPLERHCALRISTGAAIPPGATAVLQSELADATATVITPREVIPDGEHIRYAGEDVRVGDVLAEAGERISIQKLSVLASAGVSHVRAHRRPRVHLFVTGNELLPVGAKPQPGQIHNSNGLVIRKLAEQAGADVDDHGIVSDDKEATDEAVARGLAADVLLVSGGVSVGHHDHVRPALLDAGVDEIFWRVNIKPGKPLWFGRKGRALVFGLPGNPLSAVVAFKLFVEPTLHQLQGLSSWHKRTRRAVLVAPVKPDPTRTTFALANIASGGGDSLAVEAFGKQGSHRTGALAQCDGFAVVPAGAAVLPAGVNISFLPIA